jgi:hypothetical protein
MLASPEKESRRPLARLRERFTAVLEWNAADKLLLLAMILVVFVGWYLIVAVVVLTQPEAAPYVDPSQLERALRIGLALFATWLALAVLRRMRRPADRSYGRYENRSRTLHGAAALRTLSRGARSPAIRHGTPSSTSSLGGRSRRAGRESTPSFRLVRQGFEARAVAGHHRLAVTRHASLRREDDEEHC